MQIPSDIKEDLALITENVGGVYQALLTVETAEDLAYLVDALKIATSVVDSHRRRTVIRNMPCAHQARH